jgi:hypothetical protein
MKSQEGSFKLLDGAIEPIFNNKTKLWDYKFNSRHVFKVQKKELKDLPRFKLITALENKVIKDYSNALDNAVEQIKITLEREFK